VLPHLYSDPQVVRQVLDDFESASIPELHKLAWRFTKRFVQSSWESTADDLDPLRSAGIDDHEILRWIEGAIVQTWWVMSADGGGVELDGFTPATAARAVGQERESYDNSTGATSAAPGQRGALAPARARDGPAWIDMDLEAPEYRDAAERTRARYGFVPNFLAAFSRRPQLYRRHLLAFELLEAPVTERLTPLQHAMVRALVTSLNRSAYGADTSRALLERHSDDATLWDRITGDYTTSEWSPADRAVLDFAAKMARNSYKVTDKDSARFVDAGLDIAAYVEVINIVSIQTSIERAANTLGVVPDGRPLLRAR
jgi:uncharacterized peroxidase-related enzyme